LAQKEPPKYSGALIEEKIEKNRNKRPAIPERKSGCTYPLMSKDTFMLNSPQRWLSAIVALLAAGAAQSQTTGADIAASQERLQRERERLLRQQQEPSPDVRLPPSEEVDVSTIFPVEESPCFSISRISLIGEAAERFQFSLDTVTGRDGALGRCLGTAGINTVIVRMQNALIQRGYTTTQVRAAPQDLKTGELILTVLPGHVRRLRFAADASPRGTAWNAMPINEGDILNLRDIEQGLENFKRVPTGQVSGPSAQYLLGERLAGAVIGLRGGFRAMSYDGFIATPLHKPNGFRTAALTAGFSVNLAF
jgi:hemolysin activation/secretion protein